MRYASFNIRTARGRSGGAHLGEVTTVATQADKAGGTGSAGFVSWAHSSLAVDDLEVGRIFFAAAFGFETLFTETGMDRQIEQIVGAPGLVCDLVQMRHPASKHVLELIEFRPRDGLSPGDALPLRPGASHVAFIVEDLAVAKAAVESLGAVTLGTITQFDEGPAIYCRVPGGAFIELEQIAPR